MLSNMTANAPVERMPQWTCPQDGTVLVEASGELHCERGHAYSTRHEIPRFVDGATYADHFGLQWKTYARTQLDSYTGKPITAERLKRCLGAGLWQGLAGKTVLECGCGAGRFTEVLLEQGARVTSIDLSSAVDANKANFPIDEQHRIAQADIMALPFKEQSFDVVVCLGVVQHTPDPEKTIAQLYCYVKPGGTFIFDHYTIQFRWYTTPAPVYRAYLKRLPPDRALRATDRLVKFFLPLHKRFARSRIASALLARVSPVMSYYAQYPDLDDRIQREWALLDTHDALTDWFKHSRTREQIRTVLQRLGLEDIWCEYGGNGVEARGRRPFTSSRLRT